MLTNKRDELRSSMNAENQPTTNKLSSDELTELVHREHVEGTPFQIVGTEEKGYFVTLGKYRATENMPTIEDAKKEINIQNWEFFCTIISIISKDVLDYSLNQNK